MTLSCTLWFLHREETETVRGELVLSIDARDIYLYCGLLLIGIVAAIAGFAMDRRKRPT